MTDDDLSDLLRRQASRHPASAELRAAVRTQIALQAAAAQPGWRERLARLLPPWRLAGTGPSHPLRAGVAGLALGVMLTLSTLWLLPRLDANALPGELVSAHVHALRFGPLYEVASSDRHQVKPWFQGRIDYAPTVLDELRPQGFALLGGRVQTVQGHATAVLAYQTRLHMIDLFVWPSERGMAPERLQRRGFNVVRWSDGAMQYWAVSDVDAAELERFAAAWRTAAAAAH
jgi:anti-sigma factor RsiW